VERVTKLEESTSAADPDQVTGSILKHKIRIIKGAAADFFDRCCEELKDEGHGDPYPQEDIITADVDDALLKRATEVTGDEFEALKWFISPNHALGGQRPGDLLKTSKDREQVINLLGRIQHGVYS
jgi:hypothetical protein